MEGMSNTDEGAAGCSPIRARRLRSVALIVAAGLFASLNNTTAHAASATVGKARFADACALCHSAQPGDGGGGMGPSLNALNGRRAATTDKAYSYSPELRASKVVWNQATLDRFLADPSKVVPGTGMGVNVPNKAERADIVAYLLSLKPPAPKR